MEDVTEELHSLSINENVEVENASVEEKLTQCSWLDKFEKGNKNNVNKGQEKKSNYSNSSFDNSKVDISFLNSLVDNTVPGKSRGIHVSRSIKNQIEPVNHDHNSNSTNDRGTFPSNNHDNDQGFVERFDDKNGSFVNEHSSSYNNKDNCTTSSKPNCEQDLKKFNCGSESFENGNKGSFNKRGGGNFASGSRDRKEGFNREREESFESGNNGSFNNRGGGNFASGYRDRNKGFNHEREESFESGNNDNFASGYRDRNKGFNREREESFKSGNNGNFNNRGGGNFASGYRDHNERFNREREESFESGNNGSFNNRGGGNFASGYRDRNKRFNHEREESFESGNNGSFNNRGGGNFASGYRDRNERFNHEREESFESGNNGSFNNRRGGNFASGYRDRNERFNLEREESFKSGNKGSFNNRGGGNFASGYRDRNERFNLEREESYESGNKGSFNNRAGGNFASGYRDRNERFNREREESFESGNNGSFNNRRGGNFASGYRSRTQSYCHESRGKFGEQFNDNNSLYGSRNDGHKKNKDAKFSGPKKEYIPLDVDSNEDIGGIVAGLNFDKYDNIEVKVSGTDPPKCLTSFCDSGLRDVLLKNLFRFNFHKPTPVQNYSIPIIMAGRDLMASAPTGSGKTAAYALPILHNLLRQPLELIFDQNHCEPQVIIIAPTRELVIQINQFVWKFTKGTNIKCKLLYGGASPAFQKIKLLESGVHVLSATPGRLLDFVQKNIVTFSSVKYVVIDEADRMLDMGFKPDIEYILKHSTMDSCNERQTVMFSATFPAEIQHMATEYLKSNYLFVAVGEIGAACKDVVQTIRSVKKFDKKKTLLKLITEMETCDGTIVFVEQKRNADYIAAYLSENDLSTTSIHGDREQPERELALKDFKSNNMKILVATTVAARGLDIKNVNNVVNFDLPTTIDEYVHRIGRTGRLGNAGKAISFFDPDSDRSLAPDLIRILQQADQEVPEWLLSIAKKSQAAPGGASFSDIRMNVEVASDEIETEEW